MTASEREREAREAIASELCEARYWLHPDSGHHDVHTCDECYRFADQQVAAVRSAVLAEMREKVETALDAEYPYDNGDAFCALRDAIRAALTALEATDGR